MNKEHKKLLKEFDGNLYELVSGSPIFFMNPDDSERLWEDIRNSQTRLPKPNIARLPVVTSIHIPEGQVIVEKRPRYVLLPYWDVAFADWEPETAETYILEAWQVIMIVILAILVLTFIFSM